jgi:ketosteroid isomerase-like protein
MNEEEMVEFVKRGFAALGKGDIKGLLDGFTEDVEIQQPGPKDTIPFAGTYRGQEQAVQYFKTMGETQEFKKFEPREFIAQADKVAVIGYEETEVRSTGQTFELDWVIVFTFRANKIASIHIYEDTIGKVAAFRG